MKKALAIFFLALFGSTSVVSADSSTATERLFYQKGNVNLVVMLARDNCCNSQGAVENTGWIPTGVLSKNAKFTCYLTIGEVDMALACYQGNDPGRIGTRVIDTDRNEYSIRTLGLLTGAGIDNIIQDFQKNGYPDGCAAAGCFGGSEGSPSD